MPDRPDPMTDRLRRFTPDPAALDRDALLFAAGRQSARGWRFWPVLAGLLAIAQVVTVVCLWRAPSPVPPPPAAVREDGVDAVPIVPESVSPSVAPGLWSVRTSVELVDELAPVLSAAEFAVSAPPLTAGSFRQLD